MKIKSKIIIYIALTFLLFLSNCNKKGCVEGSHHYQIKIICIEKKVYLEPKKTTEVKRTTLNIFKNCVKTKTTIFNNVCVNGEWKSYELKTDEEEANDEDQHE